MKRDEWNQKKHEKEMKTLKNVLKMIRDGLYWIGSIEVHEEFLRTGVRVTIYLRPRKDG